jgi:tRNA(Ile)-lysidine synthase
MLSSYATELLPRTTFPSPGTPLACAVSGGPDSLALLTLAVIAGCDVTAYHVDHGIRPESSSEAAIVERAAERLGAGFVALRVVCLPGPNLEARARSARYAVLPTGVATGHTADDQAETILLNLLRGAGLDGLAGMRPGILHPILALRRDETERLVASANFDVVRDPSNDDARFLRNRVRRELLPLASEIAGRDLVPILCRQALLLRDDQDFLEELSSKLDPTIASDVANAPLPIARRSLRRWLRLVTPEGQPPDAAALRRVLGVAAGERVAAQISGGARIRRSKGRLLAEHAAVDAKLAAQTRS